MQRTAVGVLFGAVQLLFSRGQARTTLEDGLSSQYREVIKPRLVNELLEPPSREESAAVAPYYEYFDLCNEQVFLRLQGRVGKRTWNEWRQGISTNLSRGDIRKAWEVIVQRRDDFPDFEELRQLADSGFSSDPRSWNPLWRRILPP